MTSLRLAKINPMTLAGPWLERGLRAARLFVTDVAHGVWDIGHRSAVMLCLCVFSLGLYISSHPDLSQGLESQALAWLKDRQDARQLPQADAGPSAAALKVALAEPDAIARATASDPAELSRQQAAVAWWLSRRYHVAPEPISRLVQEAWTVGNKAKLDPTLILAVMAIESGFNPFAQSHVGAQGLMQVMTRIHDDKYQAFGGEHAAFDPVSNLRVGVQVLKECIARAGSLEGGLKFYVGAANLTDDGGYAAKVLAEQNNLREVVSGHQVPVYAPLNTTLVQAVAPATAPAATPLEASPSLEPATPTQAAVAEQVSALTAHSLSRAAQGADPAPDATRLASADAAL